MVDKKTKAQFVADLLRNNWQSVVIALLIWWMLLSIDFRIDWSFSVVS